MSAGLCCGQVKCIRASSYSHLKAQARVARATDNLLRGGEGSRMDAAARGGPRGPLSHIWRGPTDRPPRTAITAFPRALRRRQLLTHRRRAARALSSSSSPSHSFPRPQGSWPHCEPPAGPPRCRRPHTELVAGRWERPASRLVPTPPRRRAGEHRDMSWDIVTRPTTVRLRRVICVTSSCCCGRAQQADPARASRTRRASAAGCCGR